MLLRNFNHYLFILALFFELNCRTPLPTHFDRHSFTLTVAYKYSFVFFNIFCGTHGFVHCFTLHCSLTVANFLKRFIAFLKCLCAWLHLECNLAV